MSAVGVRTLPRSWYTDPAVLQLEWRERIFRHSWEYVGHVGDVSEADHLLATSVGDIPVVLVRDHETHSERSSTSAATAARSAPRVRRRETLQCPYHAGRTASTAVSITAREATEKAGSTGEELGLVPLRLETWGPLIFVNPDADVGTLADYLDGIPERIAEAGIDLPSPSLPRSAQSLNSTATGRSPPRTSSSYDCPTAHPGFSAVMDVSQTRTSSSTNAGRMTQHGPPRREPRGAYDLTARSSAASSTSCSQAPLINVMPGTAELLDRPHRPA